MDDKLVRERIKSRQCPYCGSVDIAYDNVEVDDTQAVQSASCYGCDKEWNEIYNFAGVQLKDDDYTFLSIG